MDLVSLCEGFLQGVMDEENACNLYHYADALGMPTFEHRVLTFILRNWRQVVRTEGWKLLPVELKRRADAFRTGGTHIFMLGQKDHVSWNGGERKMSKWVWDRVWSDPDKHSGDSTPAAYLMRDTAAGEKGRTGDEADEEWLTAAESEGGKSDDSREGEGGFHTPTVRSPTPTPH